MLGSELNTPALIKVSSLQQILTPDDLTIFSLFPGNKLVLEQIVTTLASVADTAEEKFSSYYDRFVPCLKYIIQNATTNELRLLRGKTIECISLIGLAVGSEKFTADAAEVMEMLLKTQTGDNELSDDDPQMSYMISAWARICKILGKNDKTVILYFYTVGYYRVLLGTFFVTLRYLWVLLGWYFWVLLGWYLCVLLCTFVYFWIHFVVVLSTKYVLVMASSLGSSDNF